MRSAQLLAWGPLLFQAAKVLRDRGVLAELIRSVPRGLTVEQVSEKTGLSSYGATVLLEAGLAARLLEREQDRFRATRVGYLFDRDPLTRVNVHCVADVCYRAAGHLAASIDEGQPKGLGELGDWATVYEGLAELEEPARTSWFEFDHFYSDDSFPLVLPPVLAQGPKRILDVGGTTGKFAQPVLRRDETVRVTVADLPGQLETCRSNLRDARLDDRVDYHPFSALRSDAHVREGDSLGVIVELSAAGEPV